MVGDYDIGGGNIKRATLHIRSIKVAEPLTNIPPSPPPPPPRPPPPPLRPPVPPLLPPVMPHVEQPPRSPVRATNLFSPDRQPVPDPPVVTNHDTNWIEDDNAVKIPFNNSECREKPWVITDPLGHKHGPASDLQRQLSRIDKFLLMLSPEKFRNMVQLTNLRLVVNKNKTTTTGKMLKMFGIMILISQNEFISRESLWSTTDP